MKERKVERKKLMNKWTNHSTKRTKEMEEKIKRKKQIKKRDEWTNYSIEQWKK